MFGFKKKGEEKHAAQGSHRDCLPLNTTTAFPSLPKAKHANALPHIKRFQENIDLYFTVKAV